MRYGDSAFNGRHRSREPARAPRIWIGLIECTVTEMPIAIQQEEVGSEWNFVPIGEILSYQNIYAGRFSHFGRNTVYDSICTNLPASNVFNTYTGYRLYQSGLVGPSH
jgi:hypothetical protein